MLHKYLGDSTLGMKTVLCEKIADHCLELFLPTGLQASAIVQAVDLFKSTPKDSLIALGSLIFSCNLWFVIYSDDPSLKDYKTSRDKPDSDVIEDDTSLSEIGISSKLVDLRLQLMKEKK